MDIFKIKKEDLIKKNKTSELIKLYKTNLVIKSGTFLVFLLLAYMLPGGFLNFLFALAGLGLGYLAYNDHVEIDEETDSQ